VNVVEHVSREGQVTDLPLRQQSGVAMVTPMCEPVPEIGFAVINPLQAIKTRLRLENLPSIFVVWHVIHGIHADFHDLAQHDGRK
jgi:hypothetical protein